MKLLSLWFEKVFACKGNTLPLVSYIPDDKSIASMLRYTYFYTLVYSNNQFHSLYRNYSSDFI